jgi:periplasmic protein TonB
MTTANINFGSFLDIVFENRNKQYGAYVLRKYYSDRLIKAFVAGVIFIMLLIGVPYVTSMFGTPEGYGGAPLIRDTIITIDPPKPPIDPPPLPPPPPGDKKITLGKLMAIDSIMQPIDTADVIIPDPPGGGGGPGAIDTTGISGPPVFPPIIDSADAPPGDPPIDVLPAFKGCLKCWLSDHLKYPQQARDGGIEGTVYVSFMVNEEGAVSDVKILRDIGGGCGAAAVNAVSSMPSWSPGMYQGKPVRYEYKLPVKFKLGR